MSEQASGPASDSSDRKTNALLQGLEETTQKVEASLSTAIQQHVNSDDFDVSQGLDFLDTKNSVMLSYIIDLTLHLRNQLTDTADDADNLHRLTVGKTVLDKMRGLDKKLRYQIDKLLAAGTNATTFVSTEEDPLQYRPDASALENDNENSSSSDEDADESASAGEHEQKTDDLDNDLAAARMTLAMARDKKKESAQEDSGVYRAPRTMAVPYTHDHVDKEAEREKRQHRRMRASELAQAMRTQYGEAPEQEDVRGGTEFGKQREAARRLAEREAEKTRFEEDQMIRLVTSRKEKKERKRLLREEGSNLAAIADLGNLVRDTNYADGRRRGRREDTDVPLDDKERHASGKRKRERIDGDARPMGKGRKSVQANNPLQAALFGEGGGKSKKKKKK